MSKRKTGKRRQATAKPEPKRKAAGIPGREGGWREVAPAKSEKASTGREKESRRHARRPRKAGEVEKLSARGATRDKKKETTRDRRISPRVVIIVVLLAACAAFAFSPLMRDIDAVSKRRKVEAKLTEEKTRTAQLERELKVAKSKQYVEQEARKQRLVAPGETLYLVTTDTGGNVKYRVKKIQSMDEAWNRVNIMMNRGSITPAAGSQPVK